MALTRNKHYLDNEGLRQVWGKITALVQSAVSTLTTLINSKVSKSGDSMTGVLQIGDGTESTNPTIDFKSADGEIWQIKRGTSGNKFGVYDTYWDNWMLHFNRDELKIVADQSLELERSGQIVTGDYCAVDGDTVNAALAGKASVSHTHTSSDVTDLSSTIDNKINALDVSDTATLGKVVTAVSETNGKITVTRKGYDAYDKATADVKDATEIITTDNGGPTSSAPLLYRRPATALWNYINGKADAIYLKTANFESQLTGTARRYFTVFNNSTTASLQYVKIFEAQLPNDGKERGGFIDSYIFEYVNSNSNVIKTCRISYIIGRNSGSNTIYSMITKSMSSYEDYILAYSATDSKYAIYAYLKAANRRNVFEVHQAYDEQNITYVQRPDPVASLPSGYTYRYAVPFNHVTQSLDLIGSNVAGIIYGKVCSYEFMNMTKSEARCVTLRINSRTVVHNVVVRAGSDGIELYDNVYGISSADRGLYGYLETVDSSWYRVTIYMMMNNYREGASITDVSFPAFNIRYTTSHDIRYFTTYNNQYVTTLPTGYVTATVNAAAKYDEDYNVIKDTYMKSSPASIELRPGNSAGNGGFIDFHFNGSTSDYTSRIIELASGNIGLNSNKVTVNGSIRYKSLYVAGTAYTVTADDGYSIYRVSPRSSSSGNKFILPALPSTEYGREVTIVCEGTGYASRDIYYIGYDPFTEEIYEMSYVLRSGSYVKFICGNGYWFSPGHNAT